MNAANRDKQFKRYKRDVHGWLVLDKPVGMTSTHAVSVKAVFSLQNVPVTQAYLIRSGFRRAADCW